MSAVSPAPTSAPVVFNFTSQALRVVMREGEPWFVAADVCEALDIKNPTDALKRLDDDERARFNLGHQGEANVINESGLYSLILGSRKPEAKKFKKWVTSEVLPAIRKTGAYIHTPAMRPGLTADQQQEIFERIRVMTYGMGNGAPLWVYNHLRVAFHVGKWEDIPTDFYDTVLALIEGKQAAAKQYAQFLRDTKDWFEKECLGGSMPWTPSIQKKLTLELQRRVILPPKVDWLALADQTKKVEA